MNILTNNPFIRILCFWILGILICKFLPNVFLIFVFVLAFLAWLAFRNHQKKSYLFDLYSSLFLACLLITLSFFNAQKNNGSVIPESYFGSYQFLILKPPVEKQNSIQLSVQVQNADSTEIINKKVVLYTEKSDTILNLKPGCQFLGQCNLKRIRNRGNPFEFDYAGYMSRQGYFYTAFIKRSKILIIDETINNPSIIAENIRLFLLEKLKEHIDDDDAFQVISALTLGYKKELSPEIKSSFASTGAMHVLAVSGLHVGMIYLFLSQLLGFLKRKKTGRIVFVGLIALFLWGYAMLTGFSPSVQRATVMFCFILIGNSLKRPTSIYNSLAASAFILLLFNPELLFEVGFQLSYMAVIAIVFFYPRIEKLIGFRYWVLRKLWQLTCVSISAQIGTFAVGIFYFHQFPVYFWLSNMVVIPAAYLILGLTCLLFAFSVVNPAAQLIAFLLETITQTTIQLLKQIELLPYSLLDNITFSTSQTIILVVTLFSIMFFIKFKRKFFLFSSLVLFIGLLSVGIYSKLKVFDQKKLIIYNSSSKIIHLINNRENYIVFSGDKKPSSYIIKNPICELSLNQPHFINLSKIDSIHNIDLIIDQGIISFLDLNIQYKLIETKQDADLFLFTNARHAHKRQALTNSQQTETLPKPTSYNIARNCAFIIDL